MIAITDQARPPILTTKYVSLEYTHYMISAKSVDRKGLFEGESIIEIMRISLSIISLLHRARCNATCISKRKSETKDRQTVQLA